MERGTRLLKVMVCAMMLVTVPVIAAGCLGWDSNDRIGIIVTIIPQEEMVKAIGGSNVAVTVMVPPGSSPHAFELDTGQMKALAKAEAYFYVGSGVEFEIVNMGAMVEQNGDMLLFDCSKGIDLKTWSEHLHGEGTHSHQLSATHDHGDEVYDSHIWLSPTNMMIMAQNVYEGLVEIDPGNQAYYEQNLQAYLEDLEDLHLEISTMLADHQGKVFLVYHPSWGYFCDDYGIEQMAIEKEGQEPTTGEIVEIVNQANAKGIKVIVISPQYDTSRAEEIRNMIDGQLILADPLMQNYVETLLDLANGLAEGFAE